MSSESELDSQMRARGVPQDQRKKILAANRLGLANPLSQLGLAKPRAGASRSRSRSRGAVDRGRGQQQQQPERLQQQPERRGVAAIRRTNDDEQDVDGFLAGARKAKEDMAKQKAVEQARKDQAAREKANRVAEIAAIAAAEERERRKKEEAEERERTQAELEQQEQERRRQLRKEEKQRKREERKRREQASRKKDGKDDESEAEGNFKEPPRTAAASRKGFFSQAFRGNHEAKAHWSEPIKGQVSNNYRGLSDRDLERRFAAQSGGASREKLMTEEEVLAMLRKGKSK